MEINVADPNDNSNEEGSISPHVPTAIRCEDGGYMIDPSEISTSPIRSFVPIDELDPTERAGFQNQFQTKSKGRGMRVTTAGKRFLGSNWPGKSDEFDELYGKQNGYIITLIVHSVPYFCSTTRQFKRPQSQGKRKSKKKGTTKKVHMD